MPFAGAPATVRPAMDHPNRALERAAGAFAPAVARLWPRPHAGYFAADSARRHLIHVLVGRLAEPGLGVARDLETSSLRRLLQAHLPLAPQGFLEALKRLEGEGWGVADYARLLGLLGGGGGGSKAVRHAPEIHRAFLATLAALPEPLRARALAEVLDEERRAQLVARAWVVALGDSPAPAAERRLADMIERAGSRAAVFDRLIDAIAERRIEAGEIPGVDWLRPILGAKAMKSAAVRYENCLRMRISVALSGDAAFYEILGAEPGVVEIVRDRRGGGWRFGEMRGMANKPLSKETLARVEAHLLRHGVRPWGKAGGLVQELVAAMGR